MATVCPLCKELVISEQVLKKWNHFAVVFNRYPYIAGHLMVIALEHKSTLNDLTREERAELIEVINETQQRLMSAMDTDSTNVGINSGEWSGASIPDHFHVHIVPRGPNDVGFYNLLCRQTPARNIIEIKERSSFKT